MLESRFCRSEEIDSSTICTGKNFYRSREAFYLADRFLSYSQTAMHKVKKNSFESGMDRELSCSEETIIYRSRSKGFEYIALVA